MLVLIAVLFSPFKFIILYLILLTIPFLTFIAFELFTLNSIVFLLNCNDVNIFWAFILTLSPGACVIIFVLFISISDTFWIFIVFIVLFAFVTILQKLIVIFDSGFFMFIAFVFVVIFVYVILFSFDSSSNATLSVFLITIPVMFNFVLPSVWIVVFKNSESMNFVIIIFLSLLRIMFLFTIVPLIRKWTSLIFRSFIVPLVLK